VVALNVKDTTIELLEANSRYAARFEIGDLPRPPAKNLAILTCLDARIMPAQLLGLDPGDAAVIRNAGGRAADAIRSLAVATRLLGVRAILVIHHTDCGLNGVSNDQIREKFAKEVGPEAGAVANSVDFLAFTDLDQSVRDDVAFIRESPLIASDIAVHGMVYDVRTGELRMVG
jgi:carbonic anhydrase